MSKSKMVESLNKLLNSGRLKLELDVEVIPKHPKKVDVTEIFSNFLKIVDKQKEVLDSVENDCEKCTGLYSLVTKTQTEIENYSEEVAKELQNSVRDKLNELERQAFEKAYGGFNGC